MTTEREKNWMRQHVIWRPPLHQGHRRKPPHKWEGVLLMRALRDNNEQVIVASCPSTLLMSLPIILSCIETGKNDHLQLAFGHEGGSSGGRWSKWQKKNHLQPAFGCKEVVVSGRWLKQLKEPPPACVWTWGRWWWWEIGQKNKKKPPPAHVGTQGRHVGRMKMTTSSSCWDMREVVVVGVTLKWQKWPPLAHIRMWGRWWWWQPGCNRC